jgi:hypothetical protein
VRYLALVLLLTACDSTRRVAVDRSSRAASIDSMSAAKVSERTDRLSLDSARLSSRTVTITVVADSQGRAYVPGVGEVRGRPGASIGVTIGTRDSAVVRRVSEQAERDSTGSSRVNRRESSRESSRRVDVQRRVRWPWWAYVLAALAAAFLYRKSLARIK